MSQFGPTPNEGGLIAGCHPAVSPGDLYGPDIAGENPSRPGTCELAPGLDIRGGVAKSGIARME
eukprot:12901551-Prorocentrum_lima.AAC.1